MKKNKSQRISVVVPVFNEEENIAFLHKRLCEVFRSLPYAVDILFVDDGSADGTLLALSKLADKDKRVRALSLSRNFGHQAALTAGLDAATGDAVITMDGDLQHPPSLIPELLREWQNGCAVVYTVREETTGEPFLKKLSSRLYYRLVNMFSETKIEPFTADFRLLDRKVVDTLKAMPERDRFLRGLIQWVGFKSKAIPYKAESRYAGTSKYTIRKMAKLALDGILSFTAAPLHFVTYIGLAAVTFALLYGIYSLYAHFILLNTVPGWTSLLITVLFLGGVQLLALGILGEYLLRIYNETKGRPIYIIKQIIGDPQNDKG